MFPHNSQITSYFSTSLEMPSWKNSRPVCEFADVFFFNNQGVVYSKFMPRGSTINSPSYCETLKNFRKAIKDQ